MEISNIIKEEINQFINNIIFEKKTKNDIKNKIEKANNRDGNNLSDSDEAQIRNDVNNGDIINIAALARKVYPDHTPEGAQSQLRKKLKGIKNDNGSEYHIKDREADVIQKVLNDLK